MIRGPKYVEVLKERSLDRNPFELFNFVKEFCLLGDSAGLEYLARESSQAAKKAIWEATDTQWCRQSDAGRHLLRKWAIENPTVQSLMHHHPDGVEMLLSIVDDTRKSTYMRAVAMRQLAMMGNKSAIPRLRRYLNDSSRFIVPYSTFPVVETLGKVARECIATLEKE
jgi:hypothetical protein